MAQPGDVPVEEYTAEEYENDAEYEVDSIVAEKKIGRITVYLVKWKVCCVHSTPECSASLSVLTRHAIAAWNTTYSLSANCAVVKQCQMLLLDVGSFSYIRTGLLCVFKAILVVLQSQPGMMKS